MALDFGLTLTGLGVLIMSLTLVIIILVCEGLKRTFKTPKIKKNDLKTLNKEDVLESEKISIEETAITVAIITYMNASPSMSKRIISLKRGTESVIWKMARRLERNN